MVCRMLMVRCLLVVRVRWWVVLRLWGRVVRWMFRLRLGWLLLLDWLLLVVCVLRLNLVFRNRVRRRVFMLLLMWMFRRVVLSGLVRRVKLMSRVLVMVWCGLMLRLLRVLFRLLRMRMFDGCLYVLYVAYSFGACWLVGCYVVGSFSAWY